MDRTSATPGMGPAPASAVVCPFLLYTHNTGDGAEVTVHVDWHSPLRPGALWSFKGCQEGSHLIDTLPWASQQQEYRGQEAENFRRVLLGFSSGQLGPLHSHQKYYLRDTKSGSEATQEPCAHLASARVCTFTQGLSYC